MFKRKIFTLLFLILLSFNSYSSVTFSRQTDRIPWGGFWWSTKNGQHVRGWKDKTTGRKKWSERNIKKFDKCLNAKKSDKKCTAMIDKLTKIKGKTLSPLMKFDFYNFKLQQKWPVHPNYDKEFSLITHAARVELKLKATADDEGFAGKCMGWAMSTMFHAEPVVTREIEGIIFTSGDIKAILATMYTASLFFTDAGAIGTECKGDCKGKAKNDVTPTQLLKGLDLTINQNIMMEADMDPTSGVWNHPIFKYDIYWKYIKDDKSAIYSKITLHYANDDEVDMEDKFTVTKTGRKRSFETRMGGNFDLVSRNLRFEAKVTKDWDENIFNISEIKKAKWVGNSKFTHPDTIVTKLNPDWLELIYEGEGESIEHTQFNYEIIKTRALINPLVQELLETYYGKKMIF